MHHILHTDQLHHAGAVTDTSVQKAPEDVSVLHTYAELSVSTLSQGHPGVGVCSSRSFSGEELRDNHLTLGHPNGGAVTFCRTQPHPG